jgi:hypothetical protein
MKTHCNEIRWFTKERNDLFEVFRSFPGLAMKETERTDFYLPTQSKDLGIKIRGEGKLEMKWLVGEKITYSIDGKERGIIEQWIKCGFECNDPLVRSIPRIPESKEIWIKIDKIRTKKKYILIENKVVPVQTFTNKYTDCEVEFTELKINDSKQFFSLAFEAFINSDISKTHLRATLEFLSDYLNAEMITLENSFAYPKVLLL